MTKPEHPWIQEMRDRMVKLAAEAKGIDPTRGYDSARRWEKIHEEISYCQDMLAYLLAGGREFVLDQATRRVVPVGI